MADKLLVRRSMGNTDITTDITTVVDWTYLTTEETFLQAAGL